MAVPVVVGPWLTRERLLVVVLLVVTAVVVYLCFQIAAPFVPALTWAIALTVIAHPLHARLCRWIDRRSIAAAITVVIVSMTLVAPSVFVVREIAAEIGRNVEKVDDEILAEQWQQAARKNPRLAPMMRWLEEEVELGEQAARLSERFIGGTSGFLSATVYAIGTLLVTMYLLFYFVRDKSGLMNAMREVMPLWTSEADQIFLRVRDTIYAIVYGTLVVSLVQGILGGLMFWWLGLPAPLTWGAVMALLSVLPAFGAAIVWLPASVYLALDGDWTRAVILATWGTLVMGLVDNLLYPVLVRNRLRLHTVPVFISILGGLVVFGAAGLVLGPVVLAVAVALLEIWRMRLASGAAEAGPGPAQAIITPEESVTAEPAVPAPELLREAQGSMTDATTGR
jgi:predicted PurR-regulated permease PerM